MFASATCRAVASASASLELTLPFLRIGGVALLQRGGIDPAERTAHEDAALILGGCIEDEISSRASGGLFSCAKLHRRPRAIRAVPVSRTGVPCAVKEIAIVIRASDVSIVSRETL